MKRIFVYGTLRKGMYNYNIYLESEDTFCAYAYVKGTLFTIQSKDYPALLLEGENMVLGEIHEVSEETLRCVDEMEGYFYDGYIENEYNRIICPIYDKNEKIIDHLPVYVFNTTKQSNIDVLGNEIVGHDYVKFIEEK